MITRVATSTSRLLLALAILFTLSACGGGGGGGGGGFKGDDGSDEDTYFLQVELVDENGNASNVATSTDPLTLRALVTLNGRNGKPVADERVEISIDMGALSPEGGSVLTNADGVATAQISANGVLGAGTAIVSVTAPNSAGDVITQEVNYQIEFADLQLGRYEGNTFIPGEIAVNAEAIPAGGSAILTVNVVDQAGEPVTTAEEISFTSTCSRSGQAVIVSPVTTETGLATSTYMAAGCTDSDEITAELEGVGSIATAVLDIAAPAAGSINFIGAAPQQIALKGTGGASRQEFANVTFEVVNDIGDPVPNEPVEFVLSTTIGGLSLASDSAVTDSDGLATATVNSGTIPTPVRVTASIEVDGGNGALTRISTPSDELIVTSGLPNQNSISLSAERLSARGGADIDGVQVVFTVRMADDFSNPVPDGTAATFRTEYGSIQSGCTTVDGACSVTWTSQSPRLPASDSGNGDTIAFGGPSPNDIVGPLETRPMISRVTVVAVGQEVFIDRNGNGIMDQAESEGDFFPLSKNLPEAFEDYNDDGAYTPDGQGDCPQDPTLDNCTASGFEEDYFDYNNNGTYDRNDEPPMYNGTLCPREGDGVWCSRELVHVFDSQNILLSSGAGWRFAPNGGSVTEGGGSVVVYIADVFNNPPVAGDTITLETAGDCSIVGETSFDPPDTNSSGAYGIAFAVEGGGAEGSTEPTATGSVTVSVESLLGKTTSASFTCITIGDPPPATSNTGSSSGLSLGGG